MRTFRYTVEVDCESAAEAQRVMAERLGADEDYGFDYTVSYRTPDLPPPHPLIGRAVKPRPGILSFGDTRTGRITDVYDPESLTPRFAVRWDKPGERAGVYPGSHLLLLGAVD